MPLPWREGIKGRGINNLKKFFNSSPSPSPLPSRERRYCLIFSHLLRLRGRGEKIFFCAYLRKSASQIT